MSPTLTGGAEGPGSGDGGAGRPGFGELARHALRYWERRRLPYNLVLLAVVLVHFYSSWPGSRAMLVPDGLLQFFVFAVLANVAYCAAYPVDLFVQFSGQRAGWVRPAVWVTGTAFAAVIAHFITGSILTRPPG